MSSELPRDRRIRVDELVVYGTAVMASFGDDFCRSLQETRASGTRWVVVFSPTGCDVMLAGLGLLDETRTRAGETTSRKVGIHAHNTFVATIGPTTRDYLVRKFGFAPDVCAAEPSPEGVRTGIVQFMEIQQHGDAGAS